MIAIVDDPAAKLDAIEALLVAEMPTRIITRELKHFTEQTEADLTTGIVTITTASERRFKNQKGMVAKEGTLSLLLLAHLRVADNGTAADVQAAELTMLAELKTALRKGVSGFSLALDSVELSRQLDRPYGWFVAFVDAGPPLPSTH